MAAITSAAIGVAVAGASTYMSVQQKKKAQKEMEGYQRQDIAPGTSPYENVQISTVGSDLMREENQRATSNAFDVLGLSGDRAIVGGVGKVVAGNNVLNREAQQYLDQQDIKRQYAITGDETALRSMREDRDNANIAAISSQIAAGEQGIQDGIMGMASGAAAMGRAVGFNDTNNKIEDEETDAGSAATSKKEVVSEVVDPKLWRKQQRALRRSQRKSGQEVAYNPYLNPDNPYYPFLPLT